MKGKRERPGRRAVPLLWTALFAAGCIVVLAWLHSSPHRQENAAPELSPAPASPPAQEVFHPRPAPPAPEAPLSPAQLRLAQMTLYEKVCQLFVVFPSDLTGTSPVTQAEASLCQALSRFPVAGFLLDSSNLVSRTQLCTLLAQLQQASSIPLLFTCDEEGGRVSRLMKRLDTTPIGPMLEYRDLGEETAFSNAQTIASDMAELGFCLNLAPVADVWSNPANTVIGDRAYSTDFEQAARLVAAAVEGFHAGAVACTLKHFPGHGDTYADSHHGSAVIDKPLDQLRREELLPFRAGIEAGADAVMLGHLILPETNGLPVPFSFPVVTGLLRQELAFDGVIITDSLKMKAITDHYTSAEAAVYAICAGADLLLAPDDPGAAVNALLRAVERGILSEARVDESVLRILTLKQRYGLLSETGSTSLSH